MARWKVNRQIEQAREDLFEAELDAHSLIDQLVTDATAGMFHQTLLLKWQRGLEERYGSAVFDGWDDTIDITDDTYPS